MEISFTRMALDPSRKLFTKEMLFAHMMEGR